MTQDSKQWEPAPPPGPTTSSLANDEPSQPPSSPSQTPPEAELDAIQDDFDYCSHLVRRFDRDRYLAAQFAPKGLRAALLGLYAFNVELGLIRENVTDPNFGEMRLQWWRDTVSQIYRAERLDNPVARALSDAAMVGRLSKEGLLNMIEARTFDLYDDPMPTLNDLEGYLGETSSAVILMASLVLTHGEDSACAEAAGYAGIAYGLTGLMRSLAHHIAQGQCYFPGDVLTRWELTPETLKDGGDALPLMVRSLCTHVSKRQQEARVRLSTVPTQAIPAFLPSSLVDLYLPKIRAAGPKLTHHVPEVAQFRRQWHMLRCAMREDF